MKNCKVAYLTTTDPNDKHAWSGTHYYILQQLRKLYSKVDALGPIQARTFLLPGQIFTKLSQVALRKRYNYRHSILASKAYAAKLNSKLDKGNYDLIVVPATSAIIPYLKTKVPIVYIGDATVSISKNYHKALTDLFKFSWNETMRIEKKAFQHCSALIFSSEWAQQSAINDFNIEKEKVHHFPFGANLDWIPDANDVLPKKINSVVQLLFIGVYWENKGGEYAVNCLNLLNQKGIPARLHIVGCKPPENLMNENIKVHAFIDKNTEEGRKKLDELYRLANFLILPTRFDCTPIVYCESSAYALPVLSANTGGVAAHVFDNENGFLIDYNDKGEAYCKKIQEILSVSKEYENLSARTRNVYDKFLNWNAWGKNFNEVIAKILP